MCIISVAEIGLGMYNAKSINSFASGFMYFTNWSVYLTALCLLVGSFVHNEDVEMVEDLNYIDDEYLKLKYTPFRAWKWYALLF